MNHELSAAMIKWCSQEIADNQTLVERIVAGGLRTMTDDGSGWRDTTEESRALAQRIIDDMKALIAKIEADGGKSPS